jgi:ribosomal protein S18 acetylase RimI-like enzyme
MISADPVVPLIRPAVPSDRPRLIGAITELQEHERKLHDTRLPGVAIAEPYLCWIERRVSERGAILVAEEAGIFVGFVAGWIEQADAIAETRDSNRFGYISDICVLPAYRGRRIATLLLGAIEARLAAAGIMRLRINALAANRSARASYERSGFVPYEVLHEKRLG